MEKLVREIFVGKANYRQIFQQLSERVVSKVGERKKGRFRFFLLTERIKRSWKATFLETVFPGTFP